jgi:hypothetical protein
MESAPPASMLVAARAGANGDLTNRRIGLVSGHGVVTSEAPVVRQRQVTVRQKDRAAGGTAA